MQQEQYKVIAGFENYMVSENGNVKNIKTGRVLNPGVNSRGYYRVVFLSCQGKKSMKGVHRLVAETFLENPDGKECVDHIDNNKLNNNISNLRFATIRENNQNASISKTNTSGYKGVDFHKQNNKWRASIYFDCKSKHLGYFDTIEEAVKVRQIKANEIHGLFVNNCEKL
jgi:hypothetical protein